MCVKTIKEITIALQQAIGEEPWIKDLQNDERKGVQQALQQFYTKRAKQQEKQQAHTKRVNFDKGYGTRIAGVDEAGRGPLAGPVVTAAVILPVDCEALVGINDSKQLSRVQREQYATIIKEHALSYAIHFQPVNIIDQLNIYEATKRSMARSVGLLHEIPDFVLVDAMTLPIMYDQESIVKGDEKSLSIAAASILAKTARDAYMDDLAVKYPEYGFEQHAGYGTKQHLAAIAKHGVLDEHRKSFEPIKSMTEGGWLT